MWYVALDTVERHIGHSASKATLRRIHASSQGNLPTALNPSKSGIEFVRIYDNSRFESRPDLVLEARRGRVVRLAADSLRAGVRRIGRECTHARASFRQLQVFPVLNVRGS